MSFYSPPTFLFHFNHIISRSPVFLLSPFEVAYTGFPSRPFLSPHFCTFYQIRCRHRQTGWRRVFEDIQRDVRIPATFSAEQLQSLRCLSMLKQSRLLSASQALFPRVSPSIFPSLFSLWNLILYFQPFQISSLVVGD